MSSVGYITFPQQTDPQDLIQRVFAYLQSKIPGWVPAEGNLDVWLIEAFGSEAADLQTLMTEVPEAVFRVLGAKLFQINPIDSVAATFTATVTAINANGYTIPQGTQVQIMDSNGNLIPFTVLQDGIIPGGTDTVDITLVAVNPGTAANGAGGVDQPVTNFDPLTWVSTIVQDTASEGGVDAESDTDYLNRLSTELTTLSPTPILPPDFSILSRNVADVQRAYTLDNYNPEDDTDDNERMVCVFALDSDGQPVSGGIKTAISAYLEALRETNFVVNTADVVEDEIDVNAVISILPGYLSSDVIGRVKAAIMSFINPASWGISSSDNPNDPITFNNRLTISYLDMGAVIKAVAGVDEITTLTMALHGDTPESADIDMSGDGRVVVPFTTDGDVLVSV